MKYAKWYGVVLLSVLGITIALFGIKLVLLPVKAGSTVVNSAGGVLDRTLNADNVLNSYEWFFDTHAQWEARRSQITAHAEMVEQEVDRKERSRLNIELAAMRQSCRDMATRYNAMSEKANKSLFKSRGLPETINPSDCETA